MNDGTMFCAILVWTSIYILKSSNNICMHYIEGTNTHSKNHNQLIQKTPKGKMETSNIAYNQISGRL